MTLRIALDPSTVSVSFVPSPLANSIPTHPTPLPVFIGGGPAGVGGAPASKVSGQEELGIVVDPGDQGVGGKKGASYWTCDFSDEYVRIDGDYRR